MTDFDSSYFRKCILPALTWEEAWVFSNSPFWPEIVEYFRKRGFK